MGSHWQGYEIPVARDLDSADLATSSEQFAVFRE